MISFNSFADANYWCRKNCYGDARPRYKTHAKIIQCGQWGWGSYDNHHSCNNNIQSYIDHYSSYYGILDAWAVAKTGPSYYPNGVKQHSNPFNGWCSGMNAKYDISDYSAAPYMMPDEEHGYDPNVYYNESEITVNEIVFNEESHAVELNDINGYLDIYSPNMPDDYNVVMITAYLDDYSSVDDSTWVDSTGTVHLPILWQAKAFMYDGQLVFEGDFEASDFNEESGSDGSRFTASNLNKTISIADDIDLDNVIIEVSTDGGSIALGVPEKFAISQNKPGVTSITNNINTTIKVGMSITPNPATNNFSLDFYNKKACNYELMIISLEGKLIKNLGKGSLNANEHKIKNFPIADLANGVYFVQMITDKGEKYSKKLIKQ